jgi:hypothetical protein
MYMTSGVWRGFTASHLRRRRICGSPHRAAYGVQNGTVRHWRIFWAQTAIWWYIDWEQPCGRYLWKQSRNFWNLTTWSNPWCGECGQVDMPEAFGERAQHQRGTSDVSALVANCCLIMRWQCLHSSAAVLQLSPEREPSAYVSGQ